MTTMASQITSLTVIYSTVYTDADQRKHQSSPSLDFVWGTHRDRWIPRTEGQLRGKCFHLMTSSWSNLYILYECCAVILYLKNKHQINYFHKSHVIMIYLTNTITPVHASSLIMYILIFFNLWRISASHLFSNVRMERIHGWITQGKLNGHLQNYFATLGFLVMLRLATDLKSRLVTAWGNTNGKNVVFFRHPRWVSLFLNQQSVQNIVFWCLICLNARVQLNVNILGVWSKVKFRYRTRNTYYRPHIYSYISHWVVCQVLTNRYLM